MPLPDAIDFGIMSDDPSDVEDPCAHDGDTPHEHRHGGHCPAELTL